MIDRVLHNRSFLGHRSDIKLCSMALVTRLSMRRAFCISSNVISITASIAFSIVFIVSVLFSICIPNYLLSPLSFLEDLVDCLCGRFSRDICSSMLSQRAAMSNAHASVSPWPSSKSFLLIRSEVPFTQNCVSNLNVRIPTITVFYGFSQACSKLLNSLTWLLVQFLKSMPC